MPLSHSMRALNLARNIVFRHHYHKNVIGMSVMKSLGVVKEPPPLKHHPSDSELNMDSVMDNDEFYFNKVVDNIEKEPKGIEKEKGNQLLEEKSPNYQNQNIISHEDRKTKENSNNDKQKADFRTFCDILGHVKSYPQVNRHRNPHEHHRDPRDNKYRNEQYDMFIENKIDFTRLNKTLDMTQLSDPMLIGREIAYRLHEPKADLIGHTVRVLGSKKASEIFVETKDIVNNGGMRTMKGTRMRSPGGTFLYILKYYFDTTLEQLEEIFKHEVNPPFINQQALGENEKSKVKRVKRKKKGGKLTKAEEKSETNTEHKNNTKPEEKPEINMEHKSNTKAVENPENNTEHKNNMKAENNTEYKRDTRAEKVVENNHAKGRHGGVGNINVKRNEEKTLCTNDVNKSREYRIVKKRLEIIIRKQLEMEKLKKPQYNFLMTQTGFKFGEDVKLVDLL